MTTVELHSKFLLNLSDIEARKIDLNFGVLLGLQDRDKFIIATSFEIINSNNTIDYEFLYKRYNQLKLVYPEFTILGIYHMSESNSSTIAMSQEVQSCSKSYDIAINPHQIYVTYNKDDKEHPFKSYSANDSHMLQTTIAISETENITASTIDKHKIYFESNGKRQREPTNIKKHIGDVAHVVKVLQKLDKNKGKEKKNEDDVEEKTDGDHSTLLKLQTTQLALLTEQKAVLDSAQSHLVKLWRLS
ncbi:hypothetical protein CANMA_004675 [Candida margitis]|uniref:uncharacterized protein n=1 Tax=Candida margitis TaxID=1775924 RepID=UPI002226F497|nr:uncharacterized protein CANMA_004675 [Candida margitis]KAI5953837.1 hypothetical protein CANMA_004675 [Candida margitis]